MKHLAPTTRHTCNTARSGSERSENTCAACHEEMARSRIPTGYGNLMGEWLKQIGRKP